MILKKITAAMLASAFTVLSVSAIAFAENNIDTSFVPDDMMNENSISSKEFTALTGITVKTLEERYANREIANIDYTFIPDDMTNENSVSPEEFTELTGITFNVISASEAEQLRFQKASNMLYNASTSSISLTWDTKKPYTNGTWDWKIVYNLDDYIVNSGYTAYATANTYSQEALETSANQSVLLSMTPNDSKSDLIRVYVHIVDEDTNAETTFSAFTLATAEKSATVSNPNNRNMNIVINLANASYSKRTGNITMEAL